MKSLDAFLLALRMMESSGDYELVNTLDYLGAYQFGEAALIDLGYVKHDGNARDNDFSGGWLGKNGIDSAEEFLQSRWAQDKAAHEWLKLMWHYLEAFELDGYADQRIGEVTLTPSGMLAATHLLGPQALEKFIASNGRANLRDAYGTTMVSYMIRLAGYDIPFA